MEKEESTKKRKKKVAQPKKQKYIAISNGICCSVGDQINGYKLKWEFFKEQPHILFWNGNFMDNKTLKVLKGKIVTSHEWDLISKWSKRDKWYTKGDMFYMFISECLLMCSVISQLNQFKFLKMIWSQGFVNM